MGHIDVLGSISRRNNLVSPADLGMMPHITSRPGIARIQELANKACLAATFACRTLEDISLLVMDVHNRWEGLEENVYR